MLIARLDRDILSVANVPPSVVIHVAGNPAKIKIKKKKRKTKGLITLNVASVKRMQARRLSPLAMHNLYIYICVHMRIDTSGRERAKAKSNELYFCSPFHEEKGWRFKRDLSVSLRGSGRPDHEASIFRLRKWVDPPNAILHLPLLPLMINIISLEMHCIIVLWL